tara:strand:+ start:6025 stop:6690 length:666 start_codon:yes stop_codon:yes gene_type:complete
MNSEHIKKSHSRSLKENKERYLHGKLLYVQNPFVKDIDLSYVIEYIEKIVPSRLMHFIDSIYVGDFEFLNKKDINAAYMDNAIYATNNQTNEQDLIDDLIHELAHSIEKNMGEEIYFDGDLEKEFLGKRQRLCDMLKAEGYSVPHNVCAELDYNKKFDNFLYQEVGYELLTNISMGIFYSPYAATSLSEYFANGFEHYFLGDRKYLNNVSPKLYNKLIELI